MTDVRSFLDAGLDHHRAGRIEDALVCYRDALAVDVDNAEAHHLLGIIALQTGRPPEAVEWFAAAIQREPANTKYLGNLGAAHLANGCPVDALKVLERAAQLDPNSVDILGNLAAALRSAGRMEDSVIAYEKAHALAPEDSAVLSGLAVSHMELGDYESAMDAADSAVTLDAKNGESRNIRGSILLSMGRYQEAVSEFETAVSLSPDLADARCNLALGYQNLYRLDEAAQTYGSVIERWPKNGSAHAGLGRTLRLQGNPGAAVASYRRAVDLNPENPRTHSNLLFNLLGDPDTSADALLEAHRAWNRRHGVPRVRDSARHENDSDPDRRLRIGYVSSDFRDHPVGRLVCPVFESHGGSSVEIVAYSQGAGEDDCTRRIEVAVEKFRRISRLDDEAVAALIASDRIDILVDLSGHSARNRLPVFARRPAPVQVTWLGYMSSTGLDAIDYLIGDPVHTPDGDELNYVEKIARLPHDLLCFSPPEDAPDVASLPCADAGFVTFGCFNNPGKITEPVLAAWAEILRAVPDGILYLRYPGYDDPGTQKSFCDRLSALGIPKGRLRFGGKSAYRDVLASYGEVDIALDSFPYSGTMTTLEALWMGVPVIAFTGDRMVARQAAAHLEAAGLSDLVGNDVTGYTELAVALAKDRTRMSDLRGNMRERLRSSPLCDVTGFAVALEALYRGMWRDWCTEGQEKR
jgi:predicted O-linked N-acetylglucosamine transferase (SPINDLY family)